MPKPRWPAPDKGFPADPNADTAPPARPGTRHAGVIIAANGDRNPDEPKATLAEDEARAVAAYYNTLQTEAAQAHYLTTPYGKDNIGDHIAQREGERYYQWLAVALLDNYSGPAGADEIKEVDKSGWGKGPPAKPGEPGAPEPKEKLSREQQKVVDDEAAASKRART